jgi:hypothetical protein
MKTNETVAVTIKKAFDRMDGGACSGFMEVSSKGITNFIVINGLVPHIYWHTDPANEFFDLADMYGSYEKAKQHMIDSYGEMELLVQFIA